MWLSSPYTHANDVYVDDNIMYSLNGEENHSKIVFPLLLNKKFTDGNLLSEKKKAADKRRWQF